MKKNPLHLVFLCLLILSGVFSLAQKPSIGGYNVYYGSLHNHTSISDGTGTPDQAYNYAKNSAKLDFFGLAEHSNMMTSTEWTTIKNTANTYNSDGIFAAFYGFEWTTFLSYGHVAVISTSDYCSNTSPTNTFTGLVSWLNARTGIAFFNHPGWDSWASNEFNKFTTTPTDKFVGMELWNDKDGFSKYYYNNGYYSNDGGKSYFDEAISRGWKIGAAGSDDNHSATWGTATNYRMGVLSPNLTRTEILNAFKERRFFATLDKNLYISFKINGFEMGSSVIGGKCNVQISAGDSDGEIFQNITLVKNGAVLQTWAPFTANPVITLPITCTSGDYFYVRVMEADGNEAISSPVFISGMQNQSPVVSITAPANNSGFNPGQTVTINATASDTDGSVAKVEFYQGSTKLGEDLTAPFEYSWVNPATGSYTLTAKAIDNLGAETISLTVNIRVEASNQPPVVSISSPANNSVFNLGQTVTINATASDTDGSVAKVEFYQGSTKLGEDLTPPYEYSLVNPTAGNYTLTVKAIDNLGAETVSPAINIKVGQDVSGMVQSKISAGSDDAEEYSSKRVVLTSTELNLVYDSWLTGNQIVGLIFRNLNIPKGVTITKAYLQFTSNRNNSGSSSLTIRGEASDNASNFTTSKGNLSGRIKTTASVAWSSIPAWTTGSKQNTPELKTIIQEIINRPGWLSTNNFAILINGSGTRVAKAYELDQANAPVLFVEYSYIKKGYINQSIIGIADENIQIKEKMEIYPNPFRNWITVKPGGDQVLDHVFIFSVSGTLVKQIDFSGISSEINIDCSDLPAGIYIVTAKHDDFTESQRIIKY